MDKVWEAAKANPIQLAPCLRAAIAEADADSWLRLDGSNLLVQVDPSPASKELQVSAYTAADFADVDPRSFVETMAARGEEGFNVSKAAVRWLADPKAKYYLPEHGGFEVRAVQGALFIFASMDEQQAGPALMTIVSQLDHPGREIALWVLMSQATPESLRALRDVDTKGLSPQALSSLKALLQGPDLIQPAPKPQVSRKEFLRVFEAAIHTDWARASQRGKSDSDLAEMQRARKPWNDFIDLFWGGQPTERDAAAVLLAEDLPLLRKLRRRVILGCNQHAIERYNNLTGLLMTIVWNIEQKK